VFAPFGGIPVGIKELEPVRGWPQTEGSLVFKDRVATRSQHHRRNAYSPDGGATPVGLTTASEFGGLNVSVTKLNGVTHNPWWHGRRSVGHPAGSRPGRGWLVPLATGGTGAGRFVSPPATRVCSVKGTYGRIPAGAHAYFTPGTIVLGCLARRRCVTPARFFDVCGATTRSIRRASRSATTGR